MDKCEALLDAVLSAIEAGQISPALKRLEENLSLLRSESTPENWNRMCRFCRTHPIAGYFYQDPFTKRAYDKPRGYPGDALLMDIIYQHPSVDPLIRAATPIGRQIYHYSIDTPATRAVRYRRATIATLIDTLTAERGPLDILSMACGHIREADISTALKERNVNRFIALDQDEKTVAKVVELYSDHKIQGTVTSARELITGRFALSGFDLIYSAGLIDYLEDSLTQHLVCRLFGMLNPGGTLLVPNFLPEIVDAGYMEAFMDWKLIYRDAATMESLAGQLPPDEVDRIDLSAVDPDANIVFMKITRR